MRDVVPAPILTVDPQRMIDYPDNTTGIFVRAKRPGEEKFISTDIITLDKPSLLAWLRATGWSEAVVLILLNHNNTLEQDEDG